MNSKIGIEIVNVLIEIIFVTINSLVQSGKFNLIWLKCLKKFG